MKDFEMEPEDEQVEAALKHFRASVHAWSEAEFGRTRRIERRRVSGMWRAMTSPAMGWALAGALMVSGVAVPVSVVHERHVAAEQAKIAAAQREQARIQAEAAQRKAELAMNDDELLKHLDSDISQATPDAMEPLASLMNDSGGK